MTATELSGKNKRWAALRAALVGAGICGLIGPCLPLLVEIPLDAFREKSSLLYALGALKVLPFVWPVAVILMGPPGALFGALGALWIRTRSRKLKPRRLWIETALAGFLLGAAVPLSMYVLAGVAKTPNPSSFEVLISMGVGSGIICALLVLLTMRRLRLLLTPPGSN